MNRKVKLAPVMWFTPYLRTLKPCPPDARLRLATSEVHSWREPQPRVTKRRYMRTSPDMAKPRSMAIAMILVAALTVIAIAGCTPRTVAPMSEWTCAGWRTLDDGRTECMQVDSGTGVTPR